MPIFHLQCLNFARTCIMEKEFVLTNYANQMSNFHYNFPKKVFFPNVY